MCSWLTLSTMMLLTKVLKAHEDFTGECSAYAEDRQYRACEYSDPIEVTSYDMVQAILSPTYPDEYTPNTHCRWRVRTNRSTDVIRFKMEEYLTEASASCNTDFIEMKDAQSTFSRVIRTWCGSENPNKPEGETVARTTDIMLTFKTDKNDNVGKGFCLKFWSVPKSDVEYKSVDYEAANYILMFLFVVIVSSLGISAVSIMMVRRHKKWRAKHAHALKPSSSIKKEKEKNHLQIVNEAEPIKRTDSNCSVTTANSRHRLVSSTQTLTTPV